MKMKRRIFFFALLASCTIGYGTDWTFSAKAITMISSLLVLISCLFALLFQKGE